MRKSAFLIFVLSMILMIGGALTFIQSERFASLVKDAMARYVPKDLGIQGDFSEFEIKLFPPGISIRNPRLQVLEHNIAGIPAGSSVVAERIDLTFKPLQMFSGNIRVDEVTIAGGDVKLKLAGSQPAAKDKSRPGVLHWDELLKVHAEAFSVRDTRFHIESGNPELNVDFMANSARVGQWSGQGGLGYELEVDLDKIQSGWLASKGFTQAIGHLGASATVNARGLEIQKLAVSLQGAALDASGRIQGNLLEPKGLAMSAKLKAQGDLKTILETLVPNPKKRPEATGHVVFEGKATGTPDKLLETLKVEGEVSGQDIHFAKWGVDTLKATLGWQASPHGGEIELAQAVLATRERERSGGLQPGDGGRLEIGAFRLSLAKLLDPRAEGGEPFEVTVPLKLERAHLHWLGAGALKAVYPLDLRASGPIELSYTAAGAGHPWGARARLDLEVEKFMLDNQRLGLVKPLHKVLQVPKVHVSGQVALDAAAIRFDAITVATGARTVFKGGGKVDFKSGFDLSFNGPVDLADIGQIAENDIRGLGTLDVHVSGPGSAVILDFDPDLKDAYYLHLRLGDLKGRITWDDDRNKLLFTKVQAVSGRTTYMTDGLIDLDKDKDTVELLARIPIGDIRDMTQVFSELTQSLWWFPRDLTGPVHGEIKVSGGISMERLVVAARVSGTDWQQWGERFGTIQLQGGYDRGKYEISDFSAVKRSGQLKGRISYGADRRVEWALHTDEFTVKDLDHLARLDVPMRGRIGIESSGGGLEGGIKSSTTVRVDDFAVRGAGMPPSLLTITSEHGKAEIKGQAFGGQGLLEARYDFAPGGASSIKGVLKHLDFSPLLLLLNPQLIQDPQIGGDISGALTLGFESGRVERASGLAELSEYHLSKSGARFELAHPVSFRISDGTFDLSDLVLKGTQGETTLSLHSDQSELEGSIGGDVDTSIVEFLTPAVSDADGLAHVDFSIGGKLKEPTIFGKVTYDEVTVKLPSLDSPFENCSGVFQLSQNRVAIQNVQADLAGGRVTAEGSVLLFADRYPQISIKGSLAGNKIKVYPFQYVKVHGDLEMNGDKLPYSVDGILKIDSALSTQSIYGQKAGTSLKALQYTPPPTQTGSNGYPVFKLNIQASADGGVFVRNDLFDIETKGSFTIVNTLEAPRILGTGEVISGKLTFKDRAFQIQAANAVFDNPAVINPSFSLTANTDVANTKIQLYATGRLNDGFKVELSSNPVMAEADILNLLATGMTPSDAKKLSASDRSMMEQGEAASLLLNSLDFNRDMQAKTGLQINIDESAAPQQQGTSVFRPQTGTDSIAQPKIVIKRQIGSKLELSYGQTVGSSATSAEKEFNAEYHVLPGISFMGVWDNYETIDTQEHTSVGADIKFQTRFK